jgi:hypothetical protein
MNDQYRYGVRAFAYLTAAVVVVIAIGVGVVGGLTTLGVVHGQLVPQTAPGVGVVGAGVGTVAVVRAMQGTSLVATDNIESNTFSFGDPVDFSLRLPPGRYRLEGTYFSSGCDTTPVEVRANTTVSVNMVCPLASP